MNKREKQKEITKTIIIKAAKEEFITCGFLKMTTAKIAKRAKIAHGTLFVHFNNKNKLIVEVLNLELSKITNELHSILEDSTSVKELLNIYLDYLITEESFFSTIYKELPFYSEDLRRQIIFNECAIRNYFYKLLDIGIMENKYKHIDITNVLTFLFGTINYFLSNKDSFISTGSIIKEKKNVILDTFFTLISKEGNKL